jgi:hypothetical protein
MANYDIGDLSDAERASSAGKERQLFRGMFEEEYGSLVGRRMQNACHFLVLKKLSSFASSDCSGHFCLLGGGTALCVEVH